MRWICLALTGVLASVPRASAAQAPAASAGTPGTASPAKPSPDRPAKPTPPSATPAPSTSATPAPSTSATPATGIAPTGAAATSPTGEPEPKDASKGSAPPEYYVEDQKKGSVAPGTSGPGDEIYEPPPPPELPPEPPPPLEPSFVAPKTAFWAGVRLEYFAPFGTLWFDGSDVGQGALVYRRRLFSAYASPGPAAEIDVGARLGRRYNVFAMWEHASLGAGDLDPDSFGGQQRGSTNLYGAGFRFSTQPNTVGFLVEIGLGYRDFRAYWADGTNLVMNDTFFDARVGFGVDIRVNRWFSLSPMVMFGVGSFTSSQFSGPNGTSQALTPLDREGEYDTVSLQIGAHADVF